MAFHIRDPETDAMTRELAKRRGVGLTEAVKQAVEVQLKRPTPKEKWTAVGEIQARIAAYPKTGLKADKAFFDELSGDDS